MAKWADSCISAVRYDADRKHIVTVKTHLDNGETIGLPKEESRTTVVSAIEAGKSYTTITKTNEGKWQKGQPVKIVLIKGKKFIKTVENDKENDNLESLPEF